MMSITPLQDKAINRHSTIKEVLEWIAYPQSMDERKERFNKVTSERKEVKEFIDFSFSQEHFFADVVKEFDEKRFRSLKYYKNVTFEVFWNREIAKFSDVNTKLNSRNKAGQLLDLFNYMSKEDVEYIYAMMKGEWIGPNRINPLFLKFVAN